MDRQLTVQPDKSDKQVIYTCPQCSKTFFRKAHMLRHVQQHTGSRPYHCQFCSKTFKRSDVLRDHYQRCDRRGSLPIPKQEERGRKRHACEQCARLKVKCDDQTPCQKCKDFGRVCVKSRASMKLTNPPDEAPAAEISTADRNSINFLLNCPGDAEFMERFPPDTKVDVSSPSVGSRGSGSATDYTIYSETEGYGRQYEKKSEDSDLLSDFETFHSNMSLENFLSTAPFGPTTGWDIEHMDLGDPLIHAHANPEFLASPDLENYATQIRQKLERCITCFPASAAPALRSSLQLLRGETLDRFVRLFFRNWYKHGPMFHQHSFNIFTVELPLLMGVFCVGGLYSKQPEEVAQLRALLDLMEFHVFNSPPFSDEYVYEHHYHSEKNAEDQARARLEEVQGAHLMVVVQYWAGTPLARKRARKQRWTRLVLVARDVRNAARFLESDVYVQDETSFRRWILQQSYRRTFSITMMLDNAFVLFNNAPSHYEWLELGNAEFACEEPMFQMSSYEEMCNSGRLPKPRPKVVDAYHLLFVPDMRNDKAALMQSASLNAWDLQVLIHWLYVHIWRQTFASTTFGASSISTAAIVKPLKLSLQNWKHIWDQLKATFSPESWAAQGFPHMAEMYWNLTKEVVFVFEQGTANQCHPIVCDCETGAHLKQLLNL